MLLDMIILAILILAALWTVMTGSMLRAAIGLACVSAALTMLMFRFHSPLAAVFELSVCSGLISVLFITAISLTQPMTRAEKIQFAKDKLNKYWYLPVFLAVICIALVFKKPDFVFDLPITETEKDVRVMLWGIRQIDLIGQIAMLIAGSFGVAILFKRMRNK